MGITLTNAHGLVIKAYTAESSLYPEVNSTSRAATKTAELKLNLYRDYLFHVDQVAERLVARARRRGE